MPGKFVHEPEVKIHECEVPDFTLEYVEDTHTNQTHKVEVPLEGSIWECVCGRRYKAVRKENHWGREYRTWKPLKTWNWSWKRER